MSKRAFRGHTPGNKKAASDRFPCGKLRKVPVTPNDRVAEARKVLGLPLGSTLSPLAFAYGRGWLDQRDLITSEAYRDAYRSANLCSPGMNTSKNEAHIYTAAAKLKREWQEMTDAEVAALRWTDLSRSEIAAIWDSAFRPIPTGEESTRRNMRQWRVMASAVTSAQLDLVNRTVLFDCWPRWIFDRHADRMDVQGERERDQLIASLRRMQSAWNMARRSLPANDEHGNDNTPMHHL